MTIGKRTKTLLSKRGMPKELEDGTGIDRDTWNNIKYGKQKVNEDHLEAIYKMYPEYKVWLATGLTFPEKGQISPEIESTAQSYQKQGKG